MPLSAADSKTLPARHQKSRHTSGESGKKRLTTVAPLARIWSLGLARPGSRGWD